MSKKFEETMQFRMGNQEKDKIVELFSTVYQSLVEKGYDPANQIIGYLVSGDPTYITSYNDSRKLITQFDRNDLLETILNFYLEKNGVK